MSSALEPITEGDLHETEIPVLLTLDRAINRLKVDGLNFCKHEETCIGANNESIRYFSSTLLGPCVPPANNCLRMRSKGRNSRY